MPRLHKALLKRACLIWPKTKAETSKLAFAMSPLKAITARQADQADDFIQPDAPDSFGA